MARKDRDLSNVFDGGKEETPKQGLEVSKPVKEATSTGEPVTFQDAFNEITRKSEEARKQKIKVEDTHERTTFLFKKELKERFNKLAQNKPHGWKSEIINDTLESMIMLEEHKQGIKPPEEN